MMDLEEFGQLIRDEREKQRLSLETASELCDLSPRGLENIELGKSDPHMGTVYRIVSGLGLSFSDFDTLLEGRPNEPGKTER